MRAAYIQEDRAKLGVVVHGSEHSGGCTDRDTSPAHFVIVKHLQEATTQGSACFQISTSSIIPHSPCTGLGWHLTEGGCDHEQPGARLACLKKVAHGVHSQRDIWRSHPLVQLVEGVRPVGGIVATKGVPAQVKSSLHRVD